jgi:hypothetical protein
MVPPVVHAQEFEVLIPDPVNFTPRGNRALLRIDQPTDRWTSDRVNGSRRFQLRGNSRCSTPSLPRGLQPTLRCICIRAALISSHPQAPFCVVGEALCADGSSLVEVSVIAFGSCDGGESDDDRRGACQGAAAVLAAGRRIAEA